MKLDTMLYIMIGCVIGIGFMGLVSNMGDRHQTIYSHAHITPKLTITVDSNKTDTLFEYYGSWNKGAE